MGIYMGVLSLEQASPFFQAVIQAREAINILLSIIDGVIAKQLLLHYTIHCLYFCSAINYQIYVRQGFKERTSYGYYTVL